jgi:hypothetical protein
LILGRFILAWVYNARIYDSRLKGVVKVRTMVNIILISSAFVGVVFEMNIYGAAFETANLFGSGWKGIAAGDIVCLLVINTFLFFLPDLTSRVRNQKYRQKCGKNAVKLYFV